jgi:hypothetical protein
MAARTRATPPAQTEHVEVAPEAPPPPNVIAALAGVLSELGGIGKMTAAQRRAAGMGAGSEERGVPYPYRGIDQIAARVQPLLGKYCVAIIPTRQHSQVTPIELGGKPWSDERLRVEWTIYGPGGVADSITAMSEGVGRDNSDKGPNKASTMAYKNLLLRIFSIGDPADDPDAERVENERNAEPKISAEQADALRAVINEIPTEEGRKAVRDEVASRWGRPNDILARDGEAASQFVSTKLREALIAIGDAGEPTGKPAANLTDAERVIEGLGDAVASVEAGAPEQGQTAPPSTEPPPPPPPGDRPQPTHPGGPRPRRTKRTSKANDGGPGAVEPTPELSTALVDAVEVGLVPDDAPVSAAADNECPTCHAAAGTACVEKAIRFDGYVHPARIVEPEAGSA